MTVMMWRWIRYEQWSSVNNPHRSRYYSNPADTVVISNSPCSASRCFNLIYYYYYHHLFSLLSEKKNPQQLLRSSTQLQEHELLLDVTGFLQGFSKEMWNYSWCWLQMLVSTFRDNIFYEVNKQFYCSFYCELLNT